MEVKGSGILWAFAVIVAASTIVGCGSGASRQLSAPTSSSTTAKIVPSGPALGAWWDAQGKGLRVVSGVPGAAIESAPTYANGAYVSASICIRKNFALLMSASGALDAATLPQGEPVTIAHVAAPNATISFSPSCNSVLVYTPAQTQALLIQGLPADAKTSNVALPAGTSTAIVADSGALLTAALAQDGSIAVVAFSSNGMPQPVTMLSKFGGMAFQPEVDSAVLADAGANIIIEASHVTGAINLAQIAAQRDGVAQPVAVGTSLDGRWIAVANSKDGSILRLDLSAQIAPSRTLCKCLPTKLEPLAGNFAFRINEPDTGTVWAFDGGAASSRIVFLPASQSVASAQGASR